MNTRTLNISAEDKALLTDEELAGMEEGQDFDEGQPEGEAIDITEEVDTAGTTDDKAKPGTEAKPDADAAGDDAAAAAAAGRDDGQPVEETATQPVDFATKLPEDYEEQVTAIGTAKTALYTSFEEGDINNIEYAQQLDDLNRKERALERLKDQAEYDHRKSHETWINVTVAGFLQDNPEYGQNQMLFTLLDQEVRKLQGESANDTDPQILVDAHAKITAAFPQVFTKAKPTKDKDGETTTLTPHRTAPSLARVPAANIDQPGENRFEALDRLQETDPLKYQRELEKLQRTNEAEYNEYMAS